MYKKQMEEDMKEDETELKQKIAILTGQNDELQNTNKELETTLNNSKEEYEKALDDLKEKFDKEVEAKRKFKSDLETKEHESQMK